MRSRGIKSTLAVAAGALTLSMPAVLAMQTPAPAGAAQGGGRQGPPPGGFQRLASLPFPDGPQIVDTSGQPVRVVPMFKGLATPWSLAFLPNGDMLITEKGGAQRPRASAVVAPLSDAFE
jgi:glucose/arabinose dehydrogenase